MVADNDDLTVARRILFDAGEPLDG